MMFGRPGGRKRFPRSRHENSAGRVRVVGGASLGIARAFAARIDMQAGASRPKPLRLIGHAHRVTSSAAMSGLSRRYLLVAKTGPRTGNGGDAVSAICCLRWATLPLWKISGIRRTAGISWIESLAAV